MTRPLRDDVEAREALELLDRAAGTSDPSLALEAAQRIARLRPRYSLRELAPARPVRAMRARYASTCGRCGQPVAVDDPITYDSATRLLTCASCAGGTQ